MTYTVVVGNAGPGAAAGVLLTNHIGLPFQQLCNKLNSSVTRAIAQLRAAASADRGLVHNQ